MKVVLLAGGYGTRISEESGIRPKPMLEIGGKPILWHIMKGYSYYGYNDFIICCGYKQHIIKEWFANYYLYNSDVMFDFTNRSEMTVYNNVSEPWRVTLVDTGLNTMTGGRIRRVRKYVGDEPFMLTYGDGVCDVDLSELVKYHQSCKKKATITAVQQQQQKGVLEIGADNAVRSFREKQSKDAALINAGFMVLEPEVFEYLDGDDCIFEQQPMQRLAEEGELMSYKHIGFWQCMDTKRELDILERYWDSGKAPWKKWKD